MSYTTDTIHRLPTSVNDRLLAASRRKSLGRGEVLISPTDTCNMVFGVISGAICTSLYSASGKRFGSTLWKAGYWFGEAYMLTGQQQAFYAEATETSEVAVLDQQKFHHLLETDPEVMMHMAKLVSTRYLRLLSWVQCSVMRPMPERIAILLCASAKRENTHQLTVHASQESLADCLGVSRQSINKFLKCWEKKGLIEIFYGSILIKDEMSLMAAAEMPMDDAC